MKILPITTQPLIRIKKKEIFVYTKPNKTNWIYKLAVEDFFSLEEIQPIDFFIEHTKEIITRNTDPGQVEDRKNELPYLEKARSAGYKWIGYDIIGGGAPEVAFFYYGSKLDKPNLDKFNKEEWTKLFTYDETTNQIAEE